MARQRDKTITNDRNHCRAIHVAATDSAYHANLMHLHKHREVRGARMPGISRYSIDYRATFAKDPFVSEGFRGLRQPTCRNYVSLAGVRCIGIEWH